MSAAIDELLERFARADAGHPLGPGAPTGATLRADGESHRAAWIAVLRRDPCAYCGARPSPTVDHVEPRSAPAARGVGGLHGWLNLVGACARCNRRKADRSLLHFLRLRPPPGPRRRRSLAA